MLAGRVNENYEQRSQCALRARDHALNGRRAGDLSERAGSQYGSCRRLRYGRTVGGNRVSLDSGTEPEARAEGRVLSLRGMSEPRPWLKSTEGSPSDADSIALGLRYETLATGSYPCPISPRGAASDVFCTVPDR